MWNKVIDDWKNPVEYIDREAAFDAITDIAGKPRRTRLMKLYGNQREH